MNGWMEGRIEGCKDGWLGGGWTGTSRGESQAREKEQLRVPGRRKAADRAREEIVSENGPRFGHSMYCQFQAGAPGHSLSQWDPNSEQGCLCGFPAGTGAPLTGAQFCLWHLGGTQGLLRAGPVLREKLPPSPAPMSFLYFFVFFWATPV